jgi:hypothetical protein
MVAHGQVLWMAVLHLVVLLLVQVLKELLWERRQFLPPLSAPGRGKAEWGRIFLWSPPYTLVLKLKQELEVKQELAVKLKQEVKLEQEVEVEVKAVQDLDSEAMLLKAWKAVPFQALSLPSPSSRHPQQADSSLAFLMTRVLPFTALSSMMGLWDLTTSPGPPHNKEMTQVWRMGGLRGGSMRVVVWWQVLLRLFTRM